jgi:hypothetical protein
MKNNLPVKQTNFLLYTGNDGKVNIEVFLKDETIWLTQKAVGQLFGKSKAMCKKCTLVIVSLCAPHFQTKESCRNFGDVLDYVN